jgi:hypothetical protein
MDGGLSLSAGIDFRRTKARASLAAIWPPVQLP